MGGLDDQDQAYDSPPLSTSDEPVPSSSTVSVTATDWSAPASATGASLVGLMVIVTVATLESSSESFAL